VSQSIEQDNVNDFVDELVYSSCFPNVVVHFIWPAHTHTQTQSFATPTSLEETFSLLTAYCCLRQLVIM